MSLVQLSFIAIAFIGLFGVIGIIAVVTGRTPKAVNKRLNWKKNQLQLVHQFLQLLLVLL